MNPANSYAFRIECLKLAKLIAEDEVLPTMVELDEKHYQWCMSYLGGDKNETF